MLILFDRTRKNDESGHAAGDRAEESDEDGRCTRLCGEDGRIGREELGSGRYRDRDAAVARALKRVR